MARKRKEKTESSIDKKLLENVKGLRAEVTEMPVSVTLETNYMPYAMSVILSRAIPEIDGFKPSHRKLLYTMYKMGLLGGQKIKSANIVGQTMQLNPHGDASIYETMVRLSKGYEALNAPFVDSKGNFGKVYSRDMAYAAPRYTEAKLTEICREIFRDIDSDTVDFVPNYDNTKTEPTLLPTSYPNLLVSANTGIAVGMASNICGFNLKETCETAIALMNDSDVDVMQTLKAPDFPTGGEIIMDEQKMREIYETGRGSFKIRAKWQYEKKGNLIEIREIPYTTTIEAVMDKIAELMKGGKLKEISDVRDESDLKGLLITIDLKRGADPEALMQKLFRMTPLLDSFSCNFNILIAGTPQVLGVREILDEWTAWREECVKRRVYFDLKRKKERLHLLMGLSKILLDIDKAIAIIRKTELEADVIPNLMTGFGIDETQAEFVAEIKLRNINREYILKKISEKEELIEDIKGLEETLKSRAKIRRLIIKELEEVIKKYGSERKSSIVYAEDIEEFTEEEIDAYPCHLIVSEQGYVKNLNPQGLKSSGEQKFKEGDRELYSFDCESSDTLLIFSDKAQVYKMRVDEIPEAKASQLGSFLSSLLEMDEDENFLDLVHPEEYARDLIFVFENGKLLRTPIDSYETKQNRRKLINAYNAESPVVKIFHLREEDEIVLVSDENRALIVGSDRVVMRKSRTAQGNAVMKLKEGKKVVSALRFSESDIKQKARYRARTFPARGAVLKEEDMGLIQMTLL